MRDGCIYCDKREEMKKYSTHLMKLDCVQVSMRKNEFGQHQLIARNSNGKFAGIDIDYCPICGACFDEEDGE